MSQRLHRNRRNIPDKLGRPPTDRELIRGVAHVDTQRVSEQWRRNRRGKRRLKRRKKPSIQSTMQLRKGVAIERRTGFAFDHAS